MATHAGVSRITAWRALNEPDRVKPATIERVEASSETLGYTVNAAARSLVSSTSGVVGVIVPTLRDSIFADTVQGLADGIDEAGLELLIGLSGYSTDREAALVRSFVGRRVDGLVLTGGAHAAPVRRLVEATGLPVVEIWEIPEAPLDMVVGFSNERLGREVVLALHDRGARRIAFARPEGRPRGVQRERGYRAALAERGLPVDEALVVDAEPTLGGGADALARLMALDSPPDAIFFNGDTMAVGAHLAGTARGLTFPGDVRLFGLHGEQIGEHVTPALSTVRVPRYRIGARAAAALVSRLANAEFELREDVGFMIEQRGTS